MIGRFNGVEKEEVRKVRAPPSRYISLLSYSPPFSPESLFSSVLSIPNDRPIVVRAGRRGCRPARASAQPHSNGERIS